MGVCGKLEIPHAYPQRCIVIIAKLYAKYERLIAVGRGSLAPGLRDDFPSALEMVEKLADFDHFGSPLSKRLQGRSVVPAGGVFLRPIKSGIVWNRYRASPQACIVLHDNDGWRDIDKALQKPVVIAINIDGQASEEFEPVCE